MKKLFASLCLVLAACGTTHQPTDAQVQRIQTACAIDAGIRPSVQALEILATPQEVAALAAARAVIDPICANPAGGVETNAITAFTSATAKVLEIRAELLQRKGKP